MDRGTIPSTPSAEGWERGLSVGEFVMFAEVLRHAWLFSELSDDQLEEHIQFHV